MKRYLCGEQDLLCELFELRGGNERHESPGYPSKAIARRFTGATGSPFHASQWHLETHPDFSGGLRHSGCIQTEPTSSVSKGDTAMAKKVKGLEDVFTDELQDLLDVEK